MLFVFVRFVVISRCLQEDSCLIYVICVCLVCSYLQLFTRRLMSYLCYLCLLGLSLSPVVYKKTHVLFTLFVFLCVEWCPTHIVCFVLFLSILCLEYPVFPVSFLPLRFSLTFIYKPLNTITEFFYLQQWSFSTQQNRSWSCFCVCKRGYFISWYLCTSLQIQLHSVSDIKKPSEKSSFFVLSYYVPLRSQFRVVVCVTVSV